MRLNAADSYRDVGRIHRLQRDCAKSSRRQIAPRVRKFDVGFFVFALESVDEILLQRPLRIGIHAFPVKREPLQDAKRHICAIGEFAPDAKRRNRLPAILDIAVGGCVSECQTPLVQRFGFNVISDHIHVRTLGKRKHNLIIAFI